MTSSIAFLPSGLAMAVTTDSAVSGTLTASGCRGSAREVRVSLPTRERLTAAVVAAGQAGAPGALGGQAGGEPGLHGGQVGAVAELQDRADDAIDLRRGDRQQGNLADDEQVTALVEGEAQHVAGGLAQQQVVIEPLTLLLGRAHEERLHPQGAVADPQVHADAELALAGEHQEPAAGVEPLSPDAGLLQERLDRPPPRDLHRLGLGPSLHAFVRRRLHLQIRRDQPTPVDRGAQWPFRHYPSWVPAPAVGTEGRRYRPAPGEERHSAQRPRVSSRWKASAQGRPNWSPIAAFQVRIRRSRSAGSPIWLEWARRAASLVSIVALMSTTSSGASVPNSRIECGRWAGRPSAVSSGAWSGLRAATTPSTVSSPAARWSGCSSQRRQGSWPTTTSGRTVRTSLATATRSAMVASSSPSTAPRNRTPAAPSSAAAAAASPRRTLATSAGSEVGSCEPFSPAVKQASSTCAPSRAQAAMVPPACSSTSSGCAPSASTRRAVSTVRASPRESGDPCSRSAGRYPSRSAPAGACGSPGPARRRRP